jgi:3-keto-disaccharide hydrolase
MHKALRFGILVLLVTAAGCAAKQSDKNAAGEPKLSHTWRSLALIKNGQPDPAWKQVGYGHFVVDDGTLRTAPDERGLGLLTYTKEKFGNCQIRVVYRSKERRSNSGVFIRIDDGILQRLDEKAPPATRDPDGAVTPEGIKAMQEGSEKEMGPWYAVHHGFEVQIADGGDEYHRTGSIYSYAPAAELPDKPRDQFRTMLITLDGDRVHVDLDGKRVTDFDSTSKDIPPRKQWHEPRRENVRPQVGYIGLQVHDPGDIVWFKEVSVRALPGK